jgi:hypothetical protein
MHDRLNGFAHVAMARVRCSDPVAQRAGLRRAAPDIVERDGAEQDLVAQIR